MAISYNLLQRGFKNVTENGQVVGFQVMIKTAYYRGVILSLIQDLELVVDASISAPTACSLRSQAGPSHSPKWRRPPMCGGRGWNRRW